MCVYDYVFEGFSYGCCKNRNGVKKRIFIKKRDEGKSE